MNKKIIVTIVGLMFSLLMMNPVLAPCTEISPQDCTPEDIRNNPALLQNNQFASIYFMNDASQMSVNEDRALELLSDMFGAKFTSLDSELEYFILNPLTIVTSTGHSLTLQPGQSLEGFEISVDAAGNIVINDIPVTGNINYDNNAFNIYNGQFNGMPVTKASIMFVDGMYVGTASSFMGFEGEDMHFIYNPETKNIIIKATRVTSIPDFEDIPLENRPIRTVSGQFAVDMNDFSSLSSFSVGQNNRLDLTITRNGQFVMDYVKLAYTQPVTVDFSSILSDFGGRVNDGQNTVTFFATDDDSKVFEMNGNFESYVFFEDFTLPEDFTALGGGSSSTDYPVVLSVERFLHDFGLLAREPIGVMDDDYIAALIEYQKIYAQEMNDMCLGTVSASGGCENSRQLTPEIIDAISRSSFFRVDVQDSMMRTTYTPQTTSFDFAGSEMTVDYSFIQNIFYVNYDKEKNMNTLSQNPRASLLTEFGLLIHNDDDRDGNYEKEESIYLAMADFDEIVEVTGPLAQRTTVIGVEYAVWTYDDTYSQDIYVDLRNAGYDDQEAREFINIVGYYSSINDINPFFTMALIKQESVFDSDSADGIIDGQVVSYAGAVGEMQIMPTTFNDLGYTDDSLLYNREINIEAGTRYLRQQLEYAQRKADEGIIPQHGPNGVLAVALSCYNAGPGYTQNRIEQHGANWRVGGNGIYDQTEDYISNIFQYYQEYQSLEMAEEFISA